MINLRDLINKDTPREELPSLLRGKNFEIDIEDIILMIAHSENKPCRYINSTCFNDRTSKTIYRWYDSDIEIVLSYSLSELKKKFYLNTGEENKVYSFFDAINNTTKITKQANILYENKFLLLFDTPWGKQGYIDKDDTTKKFIKKLDERLCSKIYQEAHNQRDQLFNFNKKLYLEFYKFSWQIYKDKDSGGKYKLEDFEDYLETMSNPQLKEEYGKNRYMYNHYVGGDSLMFYDFLSEPLTKNKILNF